MSEDKLMKFDEQINEYFEDFMILQLFNEEFYDLFIFSNIDLKSVVVNLVREVPDTTFNIIVRNAITEV